MTLADGVCRVDVPAVFGVPAAQRGVDASGGPDGVGVAVGALAHDERVHPGAREFYRRPQAGGSGADYEYVSGESVVVAIPALHCAHLFIG